MKLSPPSRKRKSLQFKNSNMRDTDKLLEALAWRPWRKKLADRFVTFPDNSALRRQLNCITLHPMSRPDRFLLVHLLWWSWRLS